jgi:hypothetical protein
MVNWNYIMVIYLSKEKMILHLRLGWEIGIIFGIVNIVIGNYLFDLFII